MLQDIAVDERKMQLFLRAVTDGALSERDRLLYYSIGEVYQELSLFIEEGDIRKRQIEALTNK